jgi:putative transposase
VVAAVAGEESCRTVASRFGVAVSSVVKWSQRYRATGSVAPGKVGGHRRRTLEPYRAFIRDRISQTAHLTLHKLKDELAARGVIVSMADASGPMSSSNSFPSCGEAKDAWRHIGELVCLKPNQDAPT